jgi:peroxiredoxin
VAAGALALVLLLAAHVGAHPASSAVEIGRPIPGFQAQSLDGQPLSLPEALAGHKAAVIVFLSTLCPYARYFAPHLRELGKTYTPRDVLFIAVYSNHWESRDEVAADAREHAFRFAVVKDEGHRVASLLDAERTPEAYLVDATGALRYRGWVKSQKESPDLQRALDAVLAGRRVRTPMTKAFGCSIDR